WSPLGATDSAGRQCRKSRTGIAQQRVSGRSTYRPGAAPARGAAAAGTLAGECLPRNAVASGNPDPASSPTGPGRSEEHTSELQSRENLVCRLLLEKNMRLKTRSPSLSSVDYLNALVLDDSDLLYYFARPFLENFSLKHGQDV